MKKIKRILSISALLVCGVANTWGQGGQKLTGKILSATNQPVEGAIVTVLDTMNVTTNKEGAFQFEVKDLSKAGEISVWAPGYFLRETANQRTFEYCDYFDSGKSI